MAYILLNIFDYICQKPRVQLRILLIEHLVSHHLTSIYAIYNFTHENPEISAYKFVLIRISR